MPKLGRAFSSFSHHLRKVFKRMRTLKAPKTLVSAIAVSIAVFLFGGGVYDILEKPVSLIPVEQQRIIFYHPYSVFEQFLVESVIAMGLYLIGAAGLVLAYKSTKYSRKPRQAFILLATAILLLVVSYLGCSWMINLRMARR